MVAGLLAALGVRAAEALPPPIIDAEDALDRALGDPRQAFAGCSELAAAQGQSGRVDVAFLPRGGRSIDFTIKKTVGLSTPIIGCVRRTLRERTRPIRLDPQGTNAAFTRTYAIGRLRLPDPARLLPLWQRLVTAPPDQRGRLRVELQGALPSSANADDSGCIAGPPVLETSVEWRAWLAGVATEVPALFVPLLRGLFGMALSSPELFWARGDWVFATESSGGGRTCLTRLDDRRKRELRAGIERLGSCWVGELDDIMAHPRVEFPADGSFKAISAGPTRSCALDPAGGLLCCGARLKEPPPPGPFQDLSVGGSSDCALRPSGAVECWGERGRPPQGLRLRRLLRSRFHGCGVTASGGVACWGEADQALAEESGRILRDSPPSGWSKGIRLERVYVGTSWRQRMVVPGPLRDIDFGYGESCAVGADGMAVCWAERARRVPPPRRPFARVSAGDQFSCGISAEELRCWGGTFDGERPALAGRFQAVSVSAGYLCALTAVGHPVCSGQRWPSAEQHGRR